MMNDRIKLAEAMGWKRNGHDFGDNTWTKDNVVAFAPGSRRDHYDEIPDPFTDANDDYAVLEWMRDPEGDGKFHYNWSHFCEILEEDMTYNHTIGDFARAALGVIE